MKAFYRSASVLLALLLLLSAAGCGAHAGQQANPDGVFRVPVLLEGGSGRASVASPAEVRAENGTYTAVIRWSSSNYDFIVVDGVTYYPVSTEGGSVFEIPIPGLECVVPVQADTVAMSQPHLIDYTLTFGGESGPEETAAAASPSEQEPLSGLTRTGRMEPEYAEQFSVERYAGGYTLVCIPADGSRFLLVPEDAAAPEGLPEDVWVLHAPVDNIYVAASAAMDLFAAADALSSVRFAGQKQDSWSSEAVRAAMESGNILYAGKYSAPDYERICAEGCALAVENAMIYHAPEVKEQLERFGIPVLVDHASYETTPQGRMEWIRLYGLLTGHEAEAEAAWQEQLGKFRALEGLAPTGKTVAYFYVNSGGAAVVRRSEDYIPALIRLAGGEYAFPELTAKDGSHSSSVAIQMEEFYAAVKDVDYLVYSSDITGELRSADELLGKCPFLASCRAFTRGQVFCTTENLYQSTMAMGDFVTDLHRMLTEDDPDMTYLYRLE